MSYAAGLTDNNPSAYFDTTKEAGVVAHPMLYWAISWPFMWTRGSELLSKAMPPNEKGRGVHYQEDAIIYKPISSGTEVVMKCKAVEALQKRKGSTLMSKYDLYDQASGDLLITHWTTTYYRGVKMGTANATSTNKADLPPALPRSNNTKTLPDEPILTHAIPVAFNEAHVYTECARIWNPIHTDKAVALQAGLPDIILHGTAHLAKAVSAIIDLYAGGDPTRVQRIKCGAFGANVFMPSTITLRIFSVDNGIVRWDLLNEQGQQAIRNGVVVLAASAGSSKL